MDKTDFKTLLIVVVGGFLLALLAVRKIDESGIGQIRALGDQGGLPSKK